MLLLFATSVTVVVLAMEIPIVVKKIREYEEDIKNKDLVKESFLERLRKKELEEIEKENNQKPIDSIFASVYTFLSEIDRWLINDRIVLDNKNKEIKYKINEIKKYVTKLEVSNLFLHKLLHNEEMIKTLYEKLIEIENNSNIEENYLSILEKEELRQVILLSFGIIDELYIEIEKHIQYIKENLFLEEKEINQILIEQNTELKEKLVIVNLKEYKKKNEATISL